MERGTYSARAECILSKIEVGDLFEKQGEDKSALDIHKVLQSAATDLEKKKIEVQIFCKGRLVKGDSFWVEYRGETFYLDFIFGTPRKQEIRGFSVYTTSFNLSS